MSSELTRLHVYERRAHLPQGFNAAVSLHCHTQHSREMMSFIPHYAARIPVVSRFYRADLHRTIDRHG